ncbi:hypothetical protein ACTXT7_002177 [Hymenolepis weldensis]
MQVTRVEDAVDVDLITTPSTLDRDGMDAAIKVVTLHAVDVPDVAKEVVEASGEHSLSSNLLFSA